MSGIIAIVGRPNVGKSALFNRVAGRRIAIVHDMPGVTRDRISAEVEWQGRPFSLIDTGGIGLLRGEKSEDVIMTAAVDQVQVAMESADVIIFVVDVREGVVPLDQEVAARLRDCGRPVLIAANKTDNQQQEEGVAEFAALGFDDVFPVSAIQARGVDDLMDKAVQFLPEVEETPKETEDGSSLATIKLAVVGRPNVGKSSLINALTQSERVIVSDIPGTTRDSVDVPFEVEADGVRHSYLLIDTAGMRKARRVNDSVEFFSVNRAERSIERSDITIFVLDADKGIVEQDKKIADKITEANRACIVVINKWDLMTEDVLEAREKEIERRQSKRKADRNREEVMTTLSDFGQWVQEKLFFLHYAPVVFTSATSGFHLDRLLETIRYVADQLRQQVPTAILNRTLRDAVERRQPVSATGVHLKFFYATQVRRSPPTFLLFLNRKEVFNEAYGKYIKKELRKAFGYEGCPIVLVPRARPKKVDSIRTVKTTRRKSVKRK